MTALNATSSWMSYCLTSVPWLHPDPSACSCCGCARPSCCRPSWGVQTTPWRPCSLGILNGWRFSVRRTSLSCTRHFLHPSSHSPSGPVHADHHPCHHPLGASCLRSGSASGTESGGYSCLHHCPLHHAAHHFLPLNLMTSFACSGSRDSIKHTGKAGRCGGGRVGIQATSQVPGPAMSRGSWHPHLPASRHHPLYSTSSH